MMLFSVLFPCFIYYSHTGILETVNEETAIHLDFEYLHRSVI